MSDTVILIDSRLVPTVEIVDHEGEVRHYSLTPCEPGIDRWAIIVERLDTGERHRVGLTLAGSWACSCKDAKFRARKERRLCKHMAAARAVRALIDRLTRQPVFEEILL